MKGLVSGILVLALVVLSACNSANNRQRKNQHEFDGQFFRATAKKTGDSLQDFEVRVRGAEKSLDGAREAGRYQATIYCIRHYGTSRKDWVTGPDDDPDSLEIDQDTLVLRGSCAG